MSPAAALGCRYVAGVALAAALLAVTDAAVPASTGVAPALALGTAAGLVLFAVVERRPPPVPSVHGGAVRVRVVTHLALVVWAGVEEVAWRVVALGRLLPALGAPLALAVTSLAFAAVHRPARPQHALAAAAFGAVYLLSGRLAAAWAAHAVYNACVAVAAEQRRRCAVDPVAPA